MDNFLYSNVLQWELSRKSAYGSFGNKEYRILSDEELWLNDESTACSENLSIILIPLGLQTGPSVVHFLHTW